MFFLVNKWKVTVKFTEHLKMTFYINDNHWQNVLTTISKLSFDTEPESIEISMEMPIRQTGVAHDYQRNRHDSGV